MHSKSFTFLLLLVIINIKFCYNAQPLPYTYAASIRVNSKPACVGMILTKTWILTLCDCVSRMKDTPEKVTARVGFISKEARIETAKQIICHQNFTTYLKTPHLNLALLRFRKDGIQLGDSVRKGFLPFNGEKKEPTHRAKVMLVGWMQDMGAYSFHTMRPDPGWRIWVESSTVGVADNCTKFKKEWKPSMICAAFIHSKAKNCYGRGTLLAYNRTVWGLMNYKNNICGGFNYYVPYVNIGQDFNLKFIVNTIENWGKATKKPQNRKS